MSDERDLSNDQRKLEAALAHLKMREPMLDPVAIAYQAGRRSAAWRLTAWRAVAAILLVAITSIALLRPAPRTVEKIVLVTAPATVSAPPLAMTNTAVFTASRSASPSDAPLTYLHLRQNVIQYGAEALPASPPAGRVEPSATQLGSWRSQSGDNL